MGPANLPLSGAARPLFKVARDAKGIIRCSQNGFWTVKDVENYIAELTPFYLQGRKSGVGVKQVSDMRGFLVQGQDVGNKFLEFDIGFRKDGDRLAMIVDSSLVRIQLRRRIARAGLEIFVSEGEAEAWIHA